MNYARHFLLLIGAAALLVAANSSRVAPRADSAFLCYGALHAFALALSRRAPQPLWRHIIFIAAAALLSLVTAHIGLYGVRYLAKLPGLAGPLLLITLSSSAGAAAYGTLIRELYIHELPWGALATASLMCACATATACVAGYHYQRLGGAWLAIPWWFAFSGGLWYYEDRIYHKGEGRAQR